MDVNIFFVSETGNSAEAAGILYNRIKNELEECNCNICNMDQFQSYRQFAKYLYRLNKNKLVYCIFVIPSYGKGDAPESLKPLWHSLLDDDLPNDLLRFDSIHATIFGLGDRKYETFNHMAIKWRQRLLSLGLNMDSHKLGLGDSQHEFGWEGELDPWIETLIDTMSSHVPKKDTLQNNNTIFPRYQIDVLQNAETDKITVHKDCDNFVISRNNGCTFNDPYHIVHDINLVGDYSCNWDSMDTIAVYPTIPYDMVTEFIHASQLNLRTLKKPVRVSEINKNCSYPPIYRSIAASGLSVIDIFTKVVDITARPSRLAMSYLAHFATGKHKEKLEEMGSFTLDGMALYDEYIRSEKRSYYDLFMDFGDYMTVPLSYILTILPPIAPRHYSISGSYVHQMNRRNGMKNTLRVLNDRLLKKVLDLASPTPSILVVESRNTTKDQRTIVGLCSNYLVNSDIGACVTAKIVRRNLRLSEGPLVCVSAGTGIAPVKCVLEEFITRQKSNYPPLVFHGVRNIFSDPLYIEELSNLPIDLNIVQSRASRSKEYVQDRIYRNKESRKKVLQYLVTNKGTLLIAGKHQPMAVQVQSYISDLVTEDAGIDGNIYMDEAIADGRIIVDAW